jgi:hypothetical protein
LEEAPTQHSYPSSQRKKEPLPSINSGQSPSATSITKLSLKSCPIGSKTFYLQSYLKIKGDSSREKKLVIKLSLSKRPSTQVNLGKKKEW